MEVLEAADLRLKLFVVSWQMANSSAQHSCKGADWWSKVIGTLVPWPSMSEYHQMLLQYHSFWLLYGYFEGQYCIYKQLLILHVCIFWLKIYTHVKSIVVYKYNLMLYASHTMPDCEWLVFQPKTGGPRSGSGLFGLPKRHRRCVQMVAPPFEHSTGGVSPWASLTPKGMANTNG